MANEQTYWRYNADRPISVAESMPTERALFIRRTYAHLAAALLAFIGLEALLLQLISPQTIFGLLGASPYSWLLVMLAFMGVSWLAQSWAQSETSPAVQYLGLGLYVVIEAFIFLPLLMIATSLPDSTNIIAMAGILTLSVFGGLTASVFVTRKDYSFLGPIICIASFLALGVIVAGILLGFQLGLLFSFCMVALLSASILYTTSNVMLHYRTDQHVAAALELFAAVATLFWYVLRIVMAFSNRQ